MRVGEQVCRGTQLWRNRLTRSVLNVGFNVPFGEVGLQTAFPECHVFLSGRPGAQRRLNDLRHVLMVGFDIPLHHCINARLQRRRRWQHRRSGWTWRCLLRWLWWWCSLLRWRCRCSGRVDGCNDFIHRCPGLLRLGKRGRDSSALNGCLRVTEKCQLAVLHLELHTRITCKTVLVIQRLQPFGFGVHRHRSHQRLQNARHHLGDVVAKQILFGSVLASLLRVVQVSLELALVELIAA